MADPRGGGTPSRAAGGLGSRRSESKTPFELRPLGWTCARRGRMTKPEPGAQDPPHGLLMSWWGPGLDRLGKSAENSGRE